MKIWELPTKLERNPPSKNIEILKKSNNNQVNQKKIWICNSVKPLNITGSLHRK